MKVIFSILLLLSLNQKLHAQDSEADREIFKHLDILMEMEILENDEAWKEKKEESKEKSNEKD